MTTPKITGEEPYYPQPIGARDSSILKSWQTGITIRQKFIMDHMRELTIKYSHPAHPTDFESCKNEAQRSFEAYLQVINGE